MWRYLALDSRGGLALPRHPMPPPPIRTGVVNLLRLTPVFVPDVYLVCKKCFYLVSKYVWAHRVMMLLYWSGRETMAKGYKCWPPLSPRTPLSLLHSQPPLLCFIQPFTHRYAWPNVSMHTNMHFLSHRFTPLCKDTHTHPHMLGPCCPISTPCGPFGFCLCLLCVGSPGHSSVGPLALFIQLEQTEIQHNHPYQPHNPALLKLQYK